MNVIETEDLTKKFDDLLALDHLNLTIEQGSIFGFLGPNGAGKTTTLRLLLGLAKPSAGTARVLGKDIHSNMLKIRQRIGYLPDVPSFYGWMKAKEYLFFVGELFKIPNQELKKRTDFLLKLADLEDVKTPIQGYSRGMKQRLGIAQALVNQPEVLILDEPTSALDPIGRKEILDMIKSLEGKTTVLFSTHILTDVERVCDTVAILNKGQLVAKSNLETLKAKYAQPVFLLELESEPTILKEKLTRESWVRHIEQKNNTLKISVTEINMGQTKLLEIISQSAILLHSFQIVEPSLEDIFIKMMEKQ